MKKLVTLFVILLITAVVRAQVRFSIATNVSVLRNFSPQQKFWSFGQGVEGDFHFRAKNTAYAWIDYHTQGSFTNTFSALAKSGSTTPAQINYHITGKWKFRQVSMGWKHYFKGAFNAEESWNLYGAAGFGLLFAKAENLLASPVDTSIYQLAPAPVVGHDEFKRLTLDMAIGTERPLAPGFFVYGDVRTSLPFIT